VALTIVHCADVHLETAFTEVRGGNRRRASLADAFVRIVDLALERHADVLTIGGDLFETERAGAQTLRFLATHLGRFGGPVFIAPGNHDPYAARGPYARAGLPPNVRVFGEAGWVPFALSEDVTLYGFAHTPAEPGPPFERARFERPGASVALVHASDADRCPARKRLTAPFTLRDVEESGATFALLGHYHGGYVTHSADGRPRFAYPGSPEPIKFGEKGAHAALVVTLDGGRVATEHVEIARSRLIDAVCDVDGAESEHDVCERVERVLGGLGADDYVRLRLEGAPRSATRVDSLLIADRFGAGLGELQVEDATSPFDVASVARELTVRGRVARDLLDLAASDDPDRAEEARLALRYALASFEGSEIVP
jgi:DNA repair protein SbcD/Mre11